MLRERSPMPFAMLPWWWLTAPDSSTSISSVFDCSKWIFDRDGLGSMPYLDGISPVIALAKFSFHFANKFINVTINHFNLVHTKYLNDSFNGMLAAHIRWLHIWISYIRRAMFPVHLFGRLLALVHPSGIFDVLLYLFNEVECVR